MPYLETPEKTDDDIYQEREAAETAESLFTETVRRTGMDEEIASRLSIDTLYAICADLDTAEDEYETWADMVASGPPPEPVGTVTGNLYDPPLDLSALPF